MTTGIETRFEMAAVLEALRIAIASGVGDPPITPGVDEASDFRLVSLANDVAIAPEQLEVLAVKLRQQPAFAKLDGAFVPASNGFGGTNLRLDQVARWLIAQSRRADNIETVVRGVADFLARNELAGLAIMSLYGVEADVEQELTAAVKLAPLRQLSPSLERGTALGQRGPFQLLAPQLGAQCALVAAYKFHPVIVEDKAQVASAMEVARNSFEKAVASLEEIRLCLTLLDLSAPEPIMTWGQLDDSLVAPSQGSSWAYSRIERPRMPKKIDVGAARELCAAYSSMTPQSRQMLHIPLERLNRAIRQRAEEDRAIDLGIALESLLLPEREPAELSFRLAMRGAWLHGNDPDKRRETFDVLRTMYKLRSQAIHGGRVKQNVSIGSTQVQTQAALERGMATCSELIRALIDKKGIIDWDSVVMGQR